MINGRILSRDEISQVWTIDRSEVTKAVYILEDGVLRLRPEFHDSRGWPPGEAEKYTPILEACHDEGGWLFGLFDDQVLVGAAVLAGHFIGASKDQLQLKFLHVSRAFRGQGRGKQLFELAKVEARRRGAKNLYISATPSENTIEFYLHFRCTVTAELDRELFALEPEDIHLVCAVADSAQSSINHV
jgi:predicted N-acetyltransferase YhbS